jgi:tripartite-type tricarboxylate transporter receptor subunit TctC
MLAAALVGLTALLGGPAGAESSYPDHTVKLLVGYAPGGPIDIISRIMADKLSAAWKQPVVVENVSGAGGNIAGDRAAKAAPDGYTLVMASNAMVAINPSLYARMSFDPSKDLTPVTLATFSPNILVVGAGVPVTSVKELVAYLKAHPGSTYASAGVGTTQHLAGELFKSMAKVDIRHVPYRGAAPAITDLLAGRVTMFFGAISSLIPFVREGKLRALAVTSEKRFGAVPNLPTMIEEGYPGFVSVLSMGIMAPTGTPAAAINKIAADSKTVLAMPDVRAKLGSIGMEVVGSTPAEFKAELDREIPQWAKVIEQAGLKGSNK